MGSVGVFFRIQFFYTFWLIIMKLDRSHRSKALSTVGDDDADDSDDDEASTWFHLYFFIWHTVVG